MEKGKRNEWRWRGTSLNTAFLIFAGSPLAEPLHLFGKKREKKKRRRWLVAWSRLLRAVWRFDSSNERIKLLTFLAHFGSYIGILVVRISSVAFKVVRDLCIYELVFSLAWTMLVKWLPFFFLQKKSVGEHARACGSDMMNCYLGKLADI